MMTKLKKIFSNPYLLSAFVGALATLLVYFVWDAPIQKYNIEIEPFESSNGRNIYWFTDDFDGDGNSERIRCHTMKGANTLDVAHYDKDGNLTDQYHFPDSEWDYGLEPSIFDLNNDNKQELLFFSVRNDSIFFNAFNLCDFNLVIKEHFFNTFERKRDEYSYDSEFYSFGDFDNNGIDELFFKFDSGFGLYPRGIFKMEFPSLKVVASPSEYMNLRLSKLEDINSDGIPEIFTSCNAPANVSGSYNKYTDRTSYIAVLDYNLDFIFEPIPFNGEFSSIQTVPYSDIDTLFYASFQCRSKSLEPLMVMTVDSNGQIINKRSWKNIRNVENLNHKLFEVNNKAHIAFKGVGTFILTPTLTRLPEELALNQDENYFISSFIDLNNDGWDEWISFNKKDEIIIYNEKLKESIRFDSPNPIVTYISVYPFYEKNEIAKFMIDTGGGFCFFSYERNEYYFLLYIIYGVVFLIGTAIIFIILLAQKHTIDKKWNTEKQLSELQFNAVKNQLNPHFLFNALNSVAYMITEGRNEEAYDFLAVNSRMIQRVMNDAKDVKRSLSDEIQFTKDYIRIQKHRFKNRFDTEFIVHPDVDVNMEVPKMCIHTYAENAIKHGFRNTKSGGLLKVNIEPEVNGILITISDNGMGRKAASEYKDSSGNGIAIMDEFYQLFEKYHGYKISCKLIDLYDSTGMVVELVIRAQT